VSSCCLAPRRLAQDLHGGFGVHNWGKGRESRYRCVRWLIGHGGSGENLLSNRRFCGGRTRTLPVSRIQAYLIIAVCVPLALTGCSSSSGSKASGTAGATSSAGTTSSPATSVAPSSSSAASSAAPSSAAPSSAAPSSAAVSSPAGAVGPPMTPRLTAIALQPADLPAGWVGTAYVPDPNSVAENAALVSCVGGRNTYTDETGDSNSPDYSLGNATISSDATSFRSQADVTNDVAIIKSPKMSGCYQKEAAAQVTASLPTGATLDSASIAIVPGAGGGPSNVIGTGVGKVTVTIAGKVSVVYVNAAFIVGPLTEAEVDFTSLGAPVATSITGPLTAKIAARAAAIAAA